MANPRNEASVRMLRDLLANVKTFFLVDYQGLSAGELNVLRAKVRQAGGRILVAKNTLVNVILKEQGFDGFDEILKGPTALVLIDDYPVEPAKVLAEFARSTRKDLPAGKGGVLQGRPVEAEALQRIAKLPSRTQLLSELVGILESPMRQLAGVLQGPQRDLVSVMTNYSKKLEEDN